MYWYYLLAIIVIAIDQFTKWLVVKNMNLYEHIPVIENFFYLTSHRNSGAAWGILQDQMIFFYIITAIVIVGVVYYMEKHTEGNSILKLAFSLILGGAIGNFIDRLINQEVVDFLDFIIFSYDFPIFNIADSALTIGVVFVFIAIFKEDRMKGKMNNGK